MVQQQLYVLGFGFISGTVDMIIVLSHAVSSRSCLMRRFISYPVRFCVDGTGEYVLSDAGLLCGAHIIGLVVDELYSGANCVAVAQDSVMG